MRIIRRRLRGILRTTIATCIPWTALGLVIGVVFELDRGAGEYMVLGRPAPSAARWAPLAHLPRCGPCGTRVLGEQVPVGSV